MNGRIYDATAARFLQADPIIQDPLNTQSLNRYSYIWNNPLNGTDPSGYYACASGWRTASSSPSSCGSFDLLQSQKDGYGGTIWDNHYGNQTLASFNQRATISVLGGIDTRSILFAAYTAASVSAQKGNQQCSGGSGTGYCTNATPGVDQSNQDNKPGLQAVFNADQLKNISALFKDGDYPGAYQYIYDQIKGLDSVTDDTKYWFKKAVEINSNSDTAANTFIRTYTAFGLDMDGKDVSPEILQNISDAIAKRVLTDVLETGGVPNIDAMVRNDIGVALEEGGQTIGGWAGSFYYWNLKYGDNGETVGELIRNNPKELDKFRRSFRHATFVTTLQHPGESIGGFFDAVGNDDSREAMRYLSD
ncbi:RHS repeat-associated core domain-containing protein [Porticoccus sp. GXU_MW_L64]